MEETITMAIYIHAFFGGLGLITGIGSILAKKGSGPHKKLGTLFSIGMLTSSLISVPISCMPNHENPFLFSIALFTIYLVLTGNRVLRYKRNKKINWVDRAISVSMLSISVLMLLLGTYGLLHSVSFSSLYAFFGAIGMFLALRDLKFYKNPTHTKSAWLLLHIGKMTGALIASITAFIVAGLGIGSILAWTVPTLLGSVYIVYWIRKTKKNVRTTI